MTRAAPAEAPVAALPLAEPHHDGSGAYVAEAPSEPGGEAVVRLRVPRALDVETVVLRYVRDGEPRAARAEVDAETETETWWRAAFPVANPVTPYRWLLAGGDVGYAWLNGAGISPHDVPDADDFVLAPGAGGPAWHLESVVYEIFPDRFARGGEEREAPSWAVPRGWDELPTGRGRETPVEWFGGDLAGIEQRLAHVERLGANVVYLTPFFPAGSTHRYDATSFERVDPLLGGDEALRSLVEAAHRRGIRVVGDLTLNHCGVDHDWFAAAAAGSAPERTFFWFDEALPNGYESWLGVPALPKLDHRAPELRRRLYEGRESVVERWLREPFGLDGWRIDVANMVARYGELDGGRDVARAVRRAVDEARADALLVAEHAHDARGDLDGLGWHGTMGYAGFLRPVWSWLHDGDDLGEGFLGLPIAIPSLGGTRVVASMRRFRAGVPWAATAHSWTLVDSHDTARFRTVAGSRERQLVGVGLQMTTPGVPMVFAGDELGLEGRWGEDARRTMPWGREADWDGALLDAYARLIALRRSSPALATGGIRYAYVDDDVIAYLREAPGDRLLCLASRDAHEPVRLPLPLLGCAELEPVTGAEATVANGWAAVPADGPEFHIWRLR